MKVLDIYGEITLKGLDKVNNDLETLLKKTNEFAIKFESIFGKIKADKLPTSQIAKELDKELKKAEVAIDKVAEKTRKAFGMSNLNKDADWSKDIADKAKELEKLRTLKDTVNSESNQQNYAEIAKNLGISDKEAKHVESLRQQVNDESSNQNYSQIAKDIAYEDRKRDRQEREEKKALDKKMKKEEEAEKKKKGFLEKQNEEAYKAFKVMSIAVGTALLKLGGKIVNNGMDMLRGSGKEGTDLWALIKTTGEDPKKVQELQYRFAKQGVATEEFRNLIVDYANKKQEALGMPGGKFSSAFGLLGIDPTQHNAVEGIQIMMEAIKRGKDPARATKAASDIFGRNAVAASMGTDFSKKVPKGVSESWGTIEANHKLDGSLMVLDQRIQRLKDSLSAKVGGGVVQVLQALVGVLTPKLIKNLGDVVLLFTKWAAAHIPDINGFVSALTTGLPAITKLLLWVTDLIFKVTGKPEDKGTSALSAGIEAYGRGDLSTFGKELVTLTLPQLSKDAAEAVSNKFRALVIPKSESGILKKSLPTNLNFAPTQKQMGKVGTTINNNTYNTAENIKVEKEVERDSNKLFAKTTTVFKAFNAPSNTKAGRY